MTNPFLKGWIDPDEINENIPIQKARVENYNESNVLNNSSHQSTVRNHPVVGGSKDNNARHLEYLIDTCNNELAKGKKKAGIKFWFKKKWNRIFKKESDNERFFIM